MAPRRERNVKRNSKFVRAGGLLMSLAFLGGCFGNDGFTFERIGRSALGAAGADGSRDTVRFNQSESVVDSAVVLSREERYYLGRAVAAQILSRYPISKDEALNAYVRRVGAATATFSDQPIQFGGYHFIVLDTDEVNAMAAPSGHIFITRGLLEILPDEDALAGVLAHEITHVTRVHGVKAISKENLSKTLLALGALAGSLNCTEVLAQATAMLGAAAGDVSETLMSKGYDRELEYEADQGSVQVLSKSGYDPKAIEEVLDALERRGKGGGGWFSTHPDPDARRTALEGFLKKHPGLGDALVDAKARDIRRERMRRYVHAAG